MPAKWLDPEEHRRLIAERSCGECMLCCKANGIEATNSPAGEWCKHADLGNGCSIYGNHPEECKMFACMWLNGMLGDDCRPDKVGVVFTMDCSSLLPDGSPFPIIVAAERHHGAAHGPLARDLISQLRELGLPVVTICANQARIVELTREGLQFGDPYLTDEYGRADMMIEPGRHVNFFDLLKIPLEDRWKFVSKPGA